jgi:hypothetical protein
MRASAVIWRRLNEVLKLDFFVLFWVYGGGGEATAVDSASSLLKIGGCKLLQHHKVLIARLAGVRRTTNVHVAVRFARNPLPSCLDPATRSHAATMQRKKLRRAGFHSISRENTVDII